MDLVYLVVLLSCAKDNKRILWKTQNWRVYHKIRHVIYKRPQITFSFSNTKIEKNLAVIISDQGELALNLNHISCEFQFEFNYI